jgi:hypothetical protein
MIEMALTLPLLIALAIPVYMFARNMMAQHMITNVSRELANLDARLPSPDMQSLMRTVAQTVTAPFDFFHHDTMYITEVQGADPCDASGAACQNLTVLRQFVWLQPGSLNRPSPIFSCNTSNIDPASGSCNNIAPNQPANFSALRGQLFRGQAVYIAESFYDDPPILGALNIGMGINIGALSRNLYSVTAF